MAILTHFHLIITNVDAPLFEGSVRSVTVPGTEGVMTILAHHEPFVSLLKEGTVRVEDGDGRQTTHEIANGILEVSSNQVTILV